MAHYSSVHHGRGRGQRRGETRRPGQWKLAYADFLTALMAFFLLMWLSTEQSAADRGTIAAYFNGNDAVSTAPDTNALSRVYLISLIEGRSELDRFSDHIHLTTTPTGLRIDLSDAAGLPLFALGEVGLNETGKILIRGIGDLLIGFPVDISIEGHTDAFHTHGERLSNWDISTGRANAARRELEASGIAANRFRRVTGLADTMPLLPNQPHAPVNRRISIVLELSR